MNNINTRKAIWILALLLFVLPVISNAQSSTSLPKVTIGVDTADNPTDVVSTLQIVLLLTVLKMRFL